MLVFLYLTRYSSIFLKKSWVNKKSRNHTRTNLNLARTSVKQILLEWFLKEHLLLIRLGSLISGCIFSVFVYFFVSKNNKNNKMDWIEDLKKKFKWKISISVLMIRYPLFVDTKYNPGVIRRGEHICKINFCIHYLFSCTVTFPL